MRPFLALRAPLVAMSFLCGVFEISALWLVPGAAHACDICAVYTATELQERRVGWRIGVAEQFSSFDDLQRDGEKVGNPADEWMHSSITQVLVGYNPSPRWGLQASLPFVHREYRRRRDDGIERGDETGIGDATLLLTVSPFSRVSERSVTRLSLLAGIKFPTGGSGRLREDLEDPLDPNDVRDRLNESMDQVFENNGLRSVRQAHLTNVVESGVHGHDLALGTGSVDPVFGVQGLWTWNRAVVAGDVQYVLRTRGNYGYRYAHELTARVLPGVFVLLQHPHTLIANVALTLETKGKDTLNGMDVGDTSLTALYLGPGFQYTFGSSASLELAADLPVLLRNTELQIVPSFRIRGGFVWRF